jgi:hypothetical protein
VHRWIGGIAVALLLLVVGVGCGGGGGDTTSDITKAQFVKKADFICADYKSKRLAAAEKEYNPKQRQGSHAVGSKATKELEAELEELAENLLQETTIPLVRTQHEKLEALGAPAGDEEKVEKMLDNMETATDKIEEEGFRGIIGGNQFDQFEKEAEKYGLTCKVV